MPTAFFRFISLFLIVEDVSDRVMRLAGFIEPIGDRQLQLMCPKPALFALRYETQPRPKELENVGGLRNQEIAGSQKWRSKRWMFQRRVFKEFHDPGTSEVRIARHVDIIRSGIFQCQANELAAPLDGWLIVQFILHGSPPSTAGSLDTLAHMPKLLNKKLA